MLSGPSSGDISAEHNATLSRLAQALDIAPTDFLDATVCDLSQTNELLRLWHEIADRQDRAKVLSMVQAMARTIASRV